MGGRGPELVPNEEGELAHSVLALEIGSGIPGPGTVVCGFVYVGLSGLHDSIPIAWTDTF